MLIIILLSGCSLLRNDGDVINDAFNSLSIKRKFFPSVVWRASIGKNKDFYSFLRPAYADGVVYVASYEGNVKAINANNGKEIWSVNLVKEDGCFSHKSVELSGGITVSDNHIYIGSEKALVYSLNIKDGSVAWKSYTVGEIFSSPVVNNGVVLVHTGNDYLVALNEYTGSAKWIVSFGAPALSFRGESAPTVVSGVGIVGSDKGYVSAVSIKDGSTVWRYFPSSSDVGESTEINYLNDIDFAPVVIGNTVYALSYNGDLTALNLFNGVVVWKCKFNFVISGFIANNNCVYLIDKNNCLFAISAKNGAVLWKRKNLLHHFLTTPVLCKGNLIIGDNKGYIYWINQEYGFLVTKKKFSRSGFFGSPTVIEDGLLLIQAKNGLLYAILC